MTALQRVTVEYIPEEDRIRISGERTEAAPLAIWLTRRLLDRILPEVLKWIEREGSDLPGGRSAGGQAAASPAIPRAELLHGFAQQAARTRVTPQEPVRVAPDDEAWLAHSVRITRARQAIGLTFQGTDGQAASVTLGSQSLRQWLNILHDNYLRADWPLDVWPDWVREAGPQPKGEGAVRH